MNVRESYGHPAVLSRFMQKVTLSLSPDTVMGDGLEAVMELLSPDLAMVFLRDGESLHYKDCRYSSPRFEHKTTANHQAGICLCGLAVSQNSPVYSLDISNDPRCVMTECKEAGIRSFAALPLRYGQDITGVLGIASGSSCDFAAQSDYLEILAGIMAVGIRNAFMYEEITQNNQELVQVRDDWEGIFQSISDPVTILSLDQRILKANRAALSFLDRRENEVLGQYCYKLFHCSDHQPPDCPHLRLIQSDQPETQVMYAEALGRTLLVSVSPVLDRQGKLARVIHYAKDISREKAAEKALAGSEQKYRLLVENMYDGLWVADANDRLIFVNQSLCSMLGYAKEELIGRPLLEFFDRVNSQRMQQELQRRQRGETAPYEVQWTRSDGQGLCTIVSPQPVLDEKGHYQGGFAVVTDITGLKKAEVQREALIQELENKNAKLEQFIYTASHDLKSPLINISGFAGMLQENLRQQNYPQAFRDLDYIQSAARKMHELMNDLLTYSRLGQVRCEKREVELAPLIKEVLDLLALQIQRQHIIVAVSPGLPRVKGDRVRLGQLFQNLLSNAIQFMGDQPEPEIHIGIIAGEEPVFFVRDNGIGIDPRYHQRIFELFERLDASGIGTGVGLTIVRRIVELHGGRTWVESKGIGQGSTFFFTLGN